jgi:2C-methyl-D-erythritol 2,4-cyclodiphosphate synthase
MIGASSKSDQLPKDQEEDLHADQDIVLERLAKAMMGEVKEGNVGAFATEDPESDGYYSGVDNQNANSISLSKQWRER